MSRKIWQKALVVLTLLALVTTLSACGSSSSTPTTTDGATLTGSAE